MDAPPSDLVQRGEELVGAARPAAPRGRLLRRLVRRKAALVGLIGVVLVLVVAVFAGPITSHDPLEQDIENVLAPPVWAGGSGDHPLGTDPLGRDIGSRLAFGARTSLQISFAAALLGALLGLVTGSIAGFFRGWLDTVLMRLGDIQLAFPFVLLAIAVLGVIPDRKPIHLILVLGIPGWIVYARVVRSRVLAERDKDYVLAARALGASRMRTLVRYVLPSVWQVVPVIALLDLGFLVIIESTLSFLGFGITPPTPSWGSILADGRQYMVITPGCRSSPASPSPSPCSASTWPPTDSPTSSTRSSRGARSAGACFAWRRRLGRMTATRRPRSSAFATCGSTSPSTTTRSTPSAASASTSSAARRWGSPARAARASPSPRSRSSS